MRKTLTVDTVVVGAGPAGYVCAIRLAQLGQKVLVVDQAEVGGVCLNRGCIPSKALIHAGSAIDRMKHVGEMGITVSGGVTLDFAKMMHWKDSVVKKLTGGVAGLLKANGCDFLAGQARLKQAHVLEVQAKDSQVTEVTFKYCVLATGSRPATLPASLCPAVDQKQILDSTGILQLTEQPESLVCVGGGYIGLELGGFYSKIGTKVTIVEGSAGLLGGMDPELTAVVQKKMEQRGIKIHLKTQVAAIKKTAAGKVEVSLQNSDQPLLVSAVLLTIGRVPNSESLGLENVGLKREPQGFLAVNAARQTQVPHIYAIGDLAGQPLLAHKGSKEGLIAAESIAGKGQQVAYSGLVMPAVVFTDPEIATVGLTEAQGLAQGLKLTVGRFPYAANGRALSIQEPEGFVKMIGDAKTGRLLGVHIVGAEASNLIAEAALALEMGAQVEDLALTIHPHPTLSEVLMEAAEVTLGHPVHIFQKKKG